MKSVPRGDYWWCFNHNQVEHGSGCPAKDRMGPYESERAARNWQQRVAERNATADAWDG